MQITAGEIARRIETPGESRPAIVHRIKSWTREGILKPLGGRNPGTGTHRVYPERAIVDAAVLSLLSKFFGASAPMVLFTGALDMVVDQLPKAKYAAEKDAPQDIFLLIAVMKGQEGEPLHAPWQVKADIQYVDMDDRARPVKAGPPDRVLRIPPLMSGGMFVNLTDLFERVRVPLDEYEREDEFYKTFRPKGPRIERG